MIRRLSLKPAAEERPDSYEEKIVNIRNFFRIVLLLWFLMVSAFVFVPSFGVLRDARNSAAPTLPELPVAPESEKIDPKEDPEVLAQRVALFQQQVKIFEHQLNAYKKQVETETADHVTKAEAFQMVVKDTLVTLVAQFLTALFAYVFVNAGAQVLDNRQRIQAKKAPQTIRIL